MNKTMSPYSRNFGRAQRLGASGKYDKALELYDGMLDVDPEFAAGLAYRGQTLHRLGRLDKAAESLCRAVELEPERFAWYTMLATVECVRGEYEAVRAAAGSALELSPANKLARAYDTLARGALGDWRNAIDSLLDMGVPCQPDFQANAFILVEREIAVHMSRADREEPLERPDKLHKTALAHVPLLRSAVAAYCLRRAERAANREQFPDAIRLGLRAYALAPDRFGIDEFMTELYLLADDVGRARLYWKKAAARRRDDPIVLYLRGRLDLVQDRAVKAVEALERSIEIDRELEDTYYWLGRAYLAADEPVRAAASFREFARREARHLHDRLRFLKKLIDEASPDSATGPSENGDSSSTRAIQSESS